MKKSILIILIINLFSNAFAADEPDKAYLDRSRELTIEGISYLYNFDIEKAFLSFNEAIQKYPQYPRPYLNKSSIALWRFLFSKSEKDYKETIKLVDKAIEVAEDYVDNYKNDADGLTCLGMAYGYKVFAEVRNENYIGAIWDLRKSYKYLNDAIKTDPKFYDAYMGLGLYHYSIGSLPKTLRWIISILGFEGNREKGIKELELAAENGLFNDMEASFYLSQFYPWLSGDFLFGHKLLSELLQKYPNNPIFLYTRGVFNINQNNVKEALKDFHKIKELNDHTIPALIYYTDFRIGEICFINGEYNEAIKFYKSFLNNYREKTYTAQAHCNIGISLEFLGNRGEAVKFYKKAIESDAKYGDDLTAVEKANIFFENFITSNDSIHIAALNNHKAGNYKKSIELYELYLVNDKLTVDQRAEAMFEMGECYFDYGKFENAAQQFGSVFKTSVQKSKWLHPWSSYMLGKIAVKQGDKQKARKFLETALKYDDYKHQRWLTYRAERELDNIK